MTTDDEPGAGMHDPNIDRCNTAEIAYAVTLAEKELSLGRGATKRERIALSYDVLAMARKIAALTRQRDAALRLAEERAGVIATLGILRPEVLAFAKAMQSLLDDNQGAKGDGWKGDKPHDLVAAVYRKTDRLFNIADIALSSGHLKESVLVAAASVGAHAMFVADVMGALGGAASPQAERVAGDEGETP